MQHAGNCSTEAEIEVRWANECRRKVKFSGNDALPMMLENRVTPHLMSSLLAGQSMNQCYAEPPMYNHCNSNRQWWFETLNDNRTESTISRSVVWPKKFNKSHNSGHFLPQQNNIVEFWVLEPTHPQSNIHERFSWGINQYWMWTSLFIVFMPRIKTWEILIGRNHVQYIRLWKRTTRTVVIVWQWHIMEY